MTGFSYQLYSSHAFPPLADTLRMLARLGYKQVEGYGGAYDDLAALTAALEETGITMSSGHFDLGMVESTPDSVLEIARATKMQAVYCPYLEAGERPTDGAGYARFGERLQKAGEPLVASGLEFGWHNHDFELQRLADGATPLEEIFRGGPALTWEADIAWIVRGGADPLDWIERHGERISAVHVKDIAPAGEAGDEDGWADLGTGTMDWQKLLAAVREKTGAHFLVLEHDKPKDHERFARRSLENALRLQEASA